MVLATVNVAGAATAAGVALLLGVIVAVLLTLGNEL